MNHGVHRRALTRAVQAATWLDLDTDAAAIRAAADLADMLDQLRASRLDQLVSGMDSKAAWHAASVHAKFQTALEQLRLTPATRPEVATDEATDLVATLRAVVTDGTATG